MIVENLYPELAKLLPDSQEVYIAVALANEKPLEDLLNLIPSDALQRVIVGVDLPTTYKALELLKMLAETKSGFKAGIYHDKIKTFHPKIYLIKKNGSWIGFIGSANLTEGGLSKNIELTYKVTDIKYCQELLEWFNSTFLCSFPIDDYNIQEYNKKSPPHENSEKVEKRHFDFRKKESSMNPLDQIDFSDRFFKREHHWAFRKELWYDNSQAANKERQEAENRFLELNSIIYPKFYDFGLKGFYTNTEGNIVSRHHQINESAPRRLEAMWLSYGKSQQDIKIYQSYVDRDDKKFQTFIQLKHAYRVCG